MSRFGWVSAVASVMLIAAACSSTREQSPPSQDATTRPTATIKDIMLSMVDPNADVLWESVATIVTAAGTDERHPRTDEDWARVRRSAITLIEASNVLVLGPRQVADPAHKSENPGIELEASEMQTLIDSDRESWVKLAHGLYDAAVPALKAIDAKDVQGLQDAGEGIDIACENCHSKYWYPPTAQDGAAGKNTVGR